MNNHLASSNCNKYIFVWSQFDFKILITLKNKLNEELLSSTKGVFSGEKYLSEEEILNAVKESQRIRENIFNDKSLLEGETPITTRPKKRNSLFGKLF